MFTRHHEWGYFVQPETSTFIDNTEQKKDLIFSARAIIITVCLTNER